MTRSVRRVAAPMAAIGAACIFTAVSWPVSLPVETSLVLIALGVVFLPIGLVLLLGRVRGPRVQRRGRTREDDARDGARLRAFWNEHADVLNLGPLRADARVEGTWHLHCEPLPDGRSGFQIVDDENSIAFRYVGGRGRYLTAARWHLDWHHRRITVDGFEPTDLFRDGSVLVLLDLRIDPGPHHRGDGSDWYLLSDHERAEAQRISIACLIERGRNQFEWAAAADGQVRVAHEGRIHWREGRRLLSARMPELLARGLRQESTLREHIDDI